MELKERGKFFDHPRPLSLLPSCLSIYLISMDLDSYSRQLKEGQFKIGTDILMVLVVFILLISGHYLVSTITDGEGKLRDVYSGVVYSLVP